LKLLDSRLRGNDKNGTVLAFYERIMIDWLIKAIKVVLIFKCIVEEAGTGFAFPSQSIDVESLPADPPEVVLPGSRAPRGNPISG